MIRKKEWQLHNDLIGRSFLTGASLHPVCRSDDLDGRLAVELRPEAAVFFGCCSFQVKFSTSNLGTSLALSGEVAPDVPDTLSSDDFALIVDVDVGAVIDDQLGVFPDPGDDFVIGTGRNWMLLCGPSFLIVLVCLHSLRIFVHVSILTRLISGLSLVHVLVKVRNDLTGLFDVVVVVEHHCVVGILPGSTR